MRRWLILCFVLAFWPSFPASSSAEIYLGIGPLDTISEIKMKFPNATFTKLNPAWAQPYDVVYSIAGAGINGIIVVNFYDAYGKWKKEVDAEQDLEKKRVLESAPSPAENSESVSWVRWIPDTPFPVTRLITKYGKPEVTTFSQVDFQPYFQWKNRGIQAFLSDDEKYVLMIEFTFTKKERDNAIERIFNFP